MRWPPSGLQKPGHVDSWIRDLSLAFQNIPVEGIFLELGNSNKAEFLECLLDDLMHLYAVHTWL